MKKIKKMERLKSPSQLNLDACINLVRVVLINAFTTYTETLIFLKENYNSFVKNKDMIEKYDKYSYTIKEVKRIKKKKKRREEEEIFLKNNKKILKIKKPQVPTPKEKYLYNKYIHYLLEKKSIEFFYGSKLFVAYTLGSDISRDQVIQKAKETACWTEKEDEKMLYV